MTAEKSKRAAYTLEYKLEAVGLVQGGQACLRGASGVVTVAKVTAGTMRQQKVSGNH